MWDERARFRVRAGWLLAAQRQDVAANTTHFVADFWGPLTNFLKNQSESLKHHELRPLNGTPLNGDGQVERGTIAEQLLIIREQPCYYGGAVSPY